MGSLQDAFHWWLSEKAEWWLEHRAGGGPVLLADWTNALWDDTRVQAAWQVAAEAMHRLELWERSQHERPSGREPKLDASQGAFAKYFKKLVRDQSVPDNIPWAVPWGEFEKKMSVPTLAKRIRGKLNVPRERFRLTSEKTYVWAGQKIFKNG
ncbi:MAG: hypothetical protein KAX19_10590 [Candidatus Brocadiae bacterium]|nr:hypothetical protein [Candidatus Brocadiia bacterium]